MLRQAAYLFVVLTSASAFLGAGESPVQIAVATVWVQNVDELREKCRTSNPIGACMHLDARLIVGCRAEGSTWRMPSPRVRGTAVRILLGTASETFHDGTRLHEIMHLRLVREGLAAYLEELRAREFRSASECLSSAEEERRQFTATMTRLAETSTRRLHVRARRAPALVIAVA